MATKKAFLKELKTRYKQLYDAVQPIPYIRDRLYCVDRVFVEGGIEYLAESWVLLGSYHLVLREARVQSNRRCLIGEPGYGKSTLTLQYAYDWCNGVQESYLKNVEILILLRLRQLGGVTSIYTAIKRFILSARSQLTEQEIESIIQNSSSVLVILDGFDEYPDEDSHSVTDVMKMIMTPVFHQFEVILTTRYLPKYYAPNTERLRLIGFDDRARDEYIRKAVAGDDVVAANTIKQRLLENPILGDLCQVPLFFVMFAHISHENKDFQTFKTVTSFFKYMIKCFHSHMRNKMVDTNVQRYHMFEDQHIELDRVAFEGLSRKNQQIVWKKRELISKLGKEFYDQYIRTGILVEEEVVDDIYGSDSASTDQYQREVRFYHKVFCEWYAAHHLAKYVIALNNSTRLEEVLRHMDPLDLQYCYRFACGLNPDAAGRIIEYVKGTDGGDKFAVLCILEQGGRVEDILDIVQDLCSRKIDFYGNGNKLLQRSTIQLLEIASSHKFIKLEPSVRLSGGVTIPYHSLYANVEFSNVHFSYPSRPEQKVLDNFSLSLPRGKVVAICGPSGAGKSTVAALLERFYDLEEGSITIDGHSLEKLDPSWLRGHTIGYINQEPTLFATSVMENIRYGKAGATDVEVMEAAVTAGAHEFISEFPQGYQTVLGERGVTVSGGQKQRIAIARAILKNPSILILDEATSALDAESERLVQASLDRLSKGRTVLVIAHRLSTIRNADVIAVLHEGKVQEIGSHDELMKKKGLYAELVKRQAQEM